MSKPPKQAHKKGWPSSTLEGGDTLGTGGAGSSVSGPSVDATIEGVREASQYQGGVDNPGFVGEGWYSENNH